MARVLGLARLSSPCLAIVSKEGVIVLLLTDSYRFSFPVPLLADWIRRLRHSESIIPQGLRRCCQETAGDFGELPGENEREVRGIVKVCYLGFVFPLDCARSRQAKHLVMSIKKTFTSLLLNSGFAPMHPAPFVTSNVMDYTMSSGTRDKTF